MFIDSFFELKIIKIIPQTNEQKKLTIFVGVFFIIHYKLIMKNPLYSRINYFLADSVVKYKYLISDIIYVLLGVPKEFIYLLLFF